MDGDFFINVQVPLLNYTILHVRTNDYYTRDCVSM